MGLGALFHRIGQAWAAYIDLDDLAIAVSGCGADPGDYELEAIDDLSGYKARRWPRQLTENERPQPSGSEHLTQTRLVRPVLDA